MLDVDAIDAVFRRVNREVWIVTAVNGPRRGGLLATWISAASIDREHPSVLAGIAPNHFTAELIDASGAFAVHLLSRQHLELAWNFAIGSGRDRDKFLGIPTVSAVTGAPILVDCLAWLDCRVFARLVAGDRIYYWADVLAGSTCGDDLPLTEHDLLAAANEQQMQALKQNRSADISLQRSLLADWRNHLPALLHPPSSS